MPDGQGLLDYLTRQDEIMSQLLQVNQSMAESLEAIRQSQGLNGGSDTDFDTNPDNGTTSSSPEDLFDIGSLPTGWMGSSLTDIDAGSYGDAEFTVAGNDVIAEIKATNNIETGDIVEIIGRDNQASSIPQDKQGGGVSISGTGVKRDTTKSAEEYITINLGRRRFFDIAYDCSNSDPDIVIEVSNNQSDWYNYETLDLSSDEYPNKSVILADTSFEYVRVKAADGSDSDVNRIEVSSKGV